MKQLFFVFIEAMCLITMLVSCWGGDELETVYPNWGNEKYVTGIQPNVRTMSVVLILKRPAQDKKAEKKEESTEKKK